MKDRIVPPTTKEEGETVMDLSAVAEFQAALDALASCLAEIDIADEIWDAVRDLKGTVARRHMRCRCPEHGPKLRPLLLDRRLKIHRIRSSPAKPSHSKRPPRSGGGLAFVHDLLQDADQILQGFDADIAGENLVLEVDGQAFKLRPQRRVDIGHGFHLAARLSGRRENIYTARQK